MADIVHFTFDHWICLNCRGEIPLEAENRKLCLNCIAAKSEETAKFPPVDGLTLEPQEPVMDITIGSK